MADLEATLAALDRVLSGPAETSFDKLFAPSFLAQIPATQLQSIFFRMVAETGGCVGHEILERPSPLSARVRWSFERGHTVEGVIGISEPSGAIVLLNFGLPSRPADTWQDLSTAIAALPGASSFELREVPSGRVLAAHEADRALGIGSSSKLAILATLLDAIAARRLRWEDLLHLEPRHASLPSGIMQTWPAGSPLTVHTAAVLLISMSDNTAADLLLDVLGRERVEGLLASTGVAAHPMRLPFLSTRGLFRLVAGDASLQERYQRGDRAERLALLAEAEKEPPEIAKLSSEPWPDEFDWFFAARDVNALLVHLAAQIDEDPHGRAVLGMNLEQIASREWAFVGFKGGSSPGRLSLAALLEARDGYRIAATLVTCAEPTALRMETAASLFRRATDLALAVHSEAH